MASGSTSRPNAKNVLRVAAALVGIVVLALAVVLALGDGDREDDIARVDAFLSDIAPKKETSTALLSPVSPQWWVLNDGLGDGSLNLAGFEYPTKATWLGFSGGRSQTPLDAASDYMPATYIGFKTPAEADKYYQKARHNKGGTPVRTDGNVVLILSPAAEFKNESFPETFGVFDGTVKKATWRWNLTEDATYVVAHSPYPGAVGNLFGDLGVSPDRENPTVWLGRATSPTQWWEGTLEGYTLDEKAKVQSAMSGFASTQGKDCNEDFSECTIVSNGLLDLLDTGILAAGDHTVGGFSADGGGTWVDVEPVGIKSDLLHGSVPPQTWRAAMLGGQTLQNPVLTRLDFRVPNKDSMSLRPHLSQAAVDAVK